MAWEVIHTFECRACRSVFTHRQLWIDGIEGDRKVTKPDIDDGKPTIGDGGRELCPKCLAEVDHVAGHSGTAMLPEGPLSVWLEERI